MLIKNLLVNAFSLMPGILLVSLAAEANKGESKATCDSPQVSALISIIDDQVQANELQSEIMSGILKLDPKFEVKSERLAVELESVNQSVKIDSWNNRDTKAYQGLQSAIPSCSLKFADERQLSDCGRKLFKREALLQKAQISWLQYGAFGKLISERNPDASRSEMQLQTSVLLQLLKNQTERWKGLKETLNASCLALKKTRDSRSLTKVDSQELFQKEAPKEVSKR